MTEKNTKESVVEALSSRMSKDISDALKYIEVHEVLGIMEMIKLSIGVTMVNTIKAEATA